MASLPPRKNGPQSKASKHSPSPLDVLLQMGFKQNRAEKALAATGDRGVQLASDWLLAHVNDPRIDDPQPRLFYLYACPTGPLLQQLEDFRRRALNQCGANGAHSLLPHVTLAAPFQVAHHKASSLSAALQRQLLAGRPALPGRWRLERYVSQNFMGLFVDEQQAEALRTTANQLAAEAARHGVKIEPQTKALHLTLAYQFPASQFQLLETLAADVDPAAPAQWEIRLYSRDPRLDGTDVYRVLYAHVPREPDELELVVGDYVYVSRGALHVSPDGWVEACSWLTGQVGFLPNNYVLAVPESDAWTVHRVVPLCIGGGDDGHSGSPASVGSCDPIRPPPPDARQLLAHGESQERLRRSLSSLGSQTSLLLPEPPTAIGLPSIAAAPPIATSRRPSLYDNVPTSTATRAGTSRQQQPRVNVSPSEQPGSSTAAPPAATSLPSGGEHANDETSPAGRRQLWVIRHGERVDFTYGQWIPYCFDEAGNYVQKDLNMPVSLRVRKEGPSGFSKDSPITQTGRLQARLTGEAMRRSGVTIDHVFCSPSLRCVETAYFVLTGLGVQTSLRMRVEPALFEWLVWYRDGQPDFLSPEQLQQWGFPVDPEYRPLVSVQELRATQESCEQYYQRSNLVSQQALRNTEGNVLLVGHAATIDTCTRQLIGKEPRVATQMTQFLGKIPYCSIVRAEERSDGGGWELVSTGFPPLTHSHNQRFDVNIIK